MLASQGPGASPKVTTVLHFDPVTVGLKPLLASFPSAVLPVSDHDLLCFCMLSVLLHRRPLLEPAEAERGNVNIIEATDLIKQCS